MTRKILPALGIIIVAIILVAVHEFTELTFITDYALICIIAGMFFGLWLSKLSDKPNENK